MYDFFFNIGNHVLEIVINWIFKIALKKDWLFAVEKNGLSTQEIHVKKCIYFFILCGHMFVEYYFIKSCMIIFCLFKEMSI